MSIKTAVIRIPRRFYDDHIERGLEAPAILKSTKSHYWIDALSPFLEELKDDADYYCSGVIDARTFPELFGLISSARATLIAILDETES